VRVGSPSIGQIVELPLEVYVARVLAGEGEPGAPGAADQALAVAIRTFARANIARHENEGFELCDETHCQVLRDSTNRSRRAAMATGGAVLLYQGVPAELFYSASCGGRTERAADLWSGTDFPYLQSRIDDVHEDDEPWTVDLSLQQIQRALEQAGIGRGRLQNVRVESRSVSERVTQLWIDGMSPIVVSGDQFRLAVGAAVLRSTAFTLERQDNIIRFTGRGYGHGVGMCVIGAGRRAARGETYGEILAQYYPGLELARMDRGALALVSRETGLPGLTPPSIAPGVVTVHVPDLSSIAADALEALVTRAAGELSAALGVRVASSGLTVNLHDSLDSFWLATGQPWWMGVVARGPVIHLAPAAVLAQRGGLDMNVRVAIGQMLLARPLVDRPTWVRVGAARYYARVPDSIPVASGVDLDCPSEAELRLAISASALRSAEARAEACFREAIARTKDWREIR
jgi:SpoIID/LytB domain protein